MQGKEALAGGVDEIHGSFGDHVAAVGPQFSLGINVLLVHGEGLVLHSESLHMLLSHKVQQHAHGPDLVNVRRAPFHSPLAEDEAALDQKVVDFELEASADVYVFPQFVAHVLHQFAGGPAPGFLLVRGESLDVTTRVRKMFLVSVIPFKGLLIN